MQIVPPAGSLFSASWDPTVRGTRPNKRKKNY